MAVFEDYTCTISGLPATAGDGKEHNGATAIDAGGAGAVAERLLSEPGGDDAHRVRSDRHGPPSPPWNSLPFLP